MAGASDFAFPLPGCWGWFGMAGLSLGLSKIPEADLPSDRTLGRRQAAHRQRKAANISTLTLDDTANIRSKRLLISSNYVTGQRIGETTVVCGCALLFSRFVSPARQPVTSGFLSCLALFLEGAGSPLALRLSGGGAVNRDRNPNLPRKTEDARKGGEKTSPHVENINKNTQPPCHQFPHPEGCAPKERSKTPSLASL